MAEPKLETHPVPLENLNDFTDYTLLYWNIKAMFLNLVDTFLWYVMGTFSLCFIIAVGASMKIIEYLGIMHYFWGQPQNWSSNFVNQVTPNLPLRNYRPENCYENTLDPLFARKCTGQNLVNPSSYLALFFAMFSALVYEPNQSHDDYLAKWDFQKEHYIRRIYQGLVFTIAARPLKNGEVALFLVFKGTSPFKLNEWLTDISLVKLAATPDFSLSYDARIKGCIHSGFYKSFFTGSNGQKLPQDRLSSLLDDIDKVLSHKELKGKKVNFWLSGHSLGAALATVFLTFLTAACQNPTCEQSAKRERLITLKSQLRGVYTFGNPRIGNTELADTVNKFLEKEHIPFFRYRNGNDIVARVPIGGGFWPALYRHMLKGADTGFIWDVDPMLDFNSIGNEIRINYNGSMSNTFKVHYNQEVAENPSQLGNLGRSTLNWFQKAGTGLVELVKSRNHTAQQDVQEYTESYTFSETLTKLLSPSLIWDHSPVQYEYHILRNRQ